MGKRSQRVLSSERFESAVKKCFFTTDDSVTIARLCLVEQKARKDVAHQYNLTTSRVSAIVNRVWREALAEMDVPEGWEHVEGYLPPETAKTVRNLMDQELSAYYEKRQKK